MLRKTAFKNLLKLFPILIFVLSVIIFYVNRDDGKVNFIDTKSEMIGEIVQTNNISMVLTGDLMLGRNVRYFSEKSGSYFYPFEKIYTHLRGSDIILSNLESPAVTDCPVIREGYTFCSPPGSIDGLVDAGINVVSIANNHNLNFGRDGFEETKSLLSAKDILYTGDGNLAKKEVSGTTFGFLGFDFTVHEPSQSDYQQILIAKKNVDFLVVSVHWGAEYEDKPREFVRRWAKEMVNSGADLIVGNHPHWVQGAECFTQGESLGYAEAEKLSAFNCLNGGVPVYYALGNFVFDQMWSEETKRGILVRLEFSDGKIINQEITKTYIKEVGQPE